MNRNTHAIIIGIITFCWMCLIPVSLFAHNDKEYVIEYLRKNGDIEKVVPIRVGNKNLSAKSPIGKDEIICWGEIEEMRVYKKDDINKDLLLDRETCENNGIQTIGQWIDYKRNPIPQKSLFRPGGKRDIKTLRDEAKRILIEVENKIVRDSIQSALANTENKSDSLSNRILEEAIDLGEASIIDSVIFKPYCTDEKKRINGEKRLALIVGNNDYNDSTLKLVTPGYDARSVAKMLRDSLGFDVILIHNAEKKRFDNAVSEFRNIFMNKEYSIGLFYYAGHGFSNKDKEDFIVSVDGKHISYNTIIKDLQAQKKLLLFFDACRNIIEEEPTLKNRLNFRWGQTMIMTSVGSGGKADDGVNNSPFEICFVKHINSKNVTTIRVLENIKRELGHQPQLFQWDSEYNNYMLHPDSVNTRGNSYWGLEASISSPLSLSGGIGLHFGWYLVKNIFSEVGTTINGLNSDELYLYNSPEALTPSESFKYNFRWDIFARIGYDGLKLGPLGIDPYLELAEQNYFSKHTANALALSGNVRIKLPFWNAYIAGGGGFAMGLGKNFGIVWHKEPLKNIYWNVQVGINFHK